MQVMAHKGMEAGSKMQVDLVTAQQRSCFFFKQSSLYYNDLFGLSS
jgi:hypothetical protein